MKSPCLKCRIPGGRGSCALQIFMHLLTRISPTFKVVGKSFHNKLSAIYEMSHLTSCAITYSQT